MAYKIFLIKKDINEATRIYVDIIKDAICLKYNLKEIDEVYDVKMISKDDILVIISLQTLLKLLVSFKNNKFIFWFQGILPEEIMMAFPGVYTKFKVPLFRWAEKYVLKNALSILMVSHEMLSHYQKKYGYKKTNYLIMPCFNQELDIDSFSKDKYATMSFVYAGRIIKWQCVEETIQLFSLIKQRFPQATLTLLTPDKDSAKVLLAKYSTQAKIDYVPLEKLKEELRKYKYGFLLRRVHPVNRVATPTKMNSYLASGIIPIYSDVMGDFQSVLKSVSYAVSCDINNYSSTIDKIDKLERMNLDPEKIKDEYQRLFSSYYNRQKYVVDISRDIIP